MIMNIIYELIDKTDKLKKLPSTVTEAKCDKYGNDAINQRYTIKMIIWTLKWSTKSLVLKF